MSSPYQIADTNKNQFIMIQNQITKKIRKKRERELYGLNHFESKQQLINILRS